MNGIFKVCTVYIGPVLILGILYTCDFVSGFCSNAAQLKLEMLTQSSLTLPITLLFEPDSATRCKQHGPSCLSLTHLTTQCIYFIPLAFSPLQSLSFSSNSNKYLCSCIYVFRRYCVPLRTPNVHKCSL